jgi:hypothetical protein
MYLLFNMLGFSVQQLELELVTLTGNVMHQTVLRYECLIAVNGSKQHLPRIMLVTNFPLTDRRPSSQTVFDSRRHTCI